MYYVWLGIEVVCLITISCLLVSSIYDLIKHGL